MKPPYYAVIFTSKRTPQDAGYTEMATRMVELAKKQAGFLGIDSAREEIGITISYWENLEAIQNWKENAEHRLAQEKGKKLWYSEYTIRIAKVEKEYGWEK